MVINTRKFRIEWGHCDPAGIVFYPRYFEIFDSCLSSLFEQATGLTKHQMMEAYAFSGYPAVQARAQFMAPARFGDDVTIETCIAEFRRSSFDVQHRLFNGGRLSVEGLVTRVWVAPDPDDAAKLKASLIPPEIIASLSGEPLPA